MKVVFIGEENPIRWESVEGAHFTYGKQYIHLPFPEQIKKELNVRDDMGTWYWVNKKFFVTLEQWREIQIEKTFKTI